MSNNTYERLNIIFRDILEDESISLQPETTAYDIETWDSLNHILLVVEMEKEFGVKFETAQIASWKNVGDIVEAIEK